VDDVFPDKLEDDEIQVLIGYRSDRGRSRAKRVAAKHRKKTGSRSAGRKKSGGKSEKDFAKIRAIAITTTKTDLKDLELDDDIEYIEPDRELYMLANVVPYGISISQGASSGIRRPTNPVRAGNCSNPNALRVAIIDSGIDGKHPDLQCRRNNGAGCIGKSYVSDAWDNDLFSHGTDSLYWAWAQG
jgi:subtilisin family serine protease